MIRRLYVDNFRSLVDFTWEPRKETLVLGYNGSGKTSALEVIEFLQGICTELGSLGDINLGLFASDNTSWRDESTIRIELDVEVHQHRYTYRLSVSPKADNETARIVSESLSLDERRLFSREGQKAWLMASGIETPFPISPHLSVVSIVGDEFGGDAILPFREYMAGILYIKPSPVLLYAFREGKATHPEASLRNLVPWYLNLAEEPAFVELVNELLRDVWSELIEVRTPEFRPDVFDFVLRVRDSSSREFHDVPLRTLSDGERILVGLYVIAAYQRTHPATTIIIDEPDNYVSLFELQPWLSRMLNDRPDDGQLILVSHNPEIIQTMGRHRVAYFSRENHLSPTKVSSLPPDESGLPLSELLARGWVDA